MSKSKGGPDAVWHDPDDAPEWTEEMFAMAEARIGDRIVREATGYLGPNGVTQGRPPLGGAAKRQVTLRLDPDVLDKFREGGAGQQSRLNAALRKAAG